MDDYFAREAEIMYILHVYDMEGLVLTVYI